MLYIKKNNINELFFTLNEKTTLSLPNYFLQLKSNNSTSSKNLLLEYSANTSTNFERYDKFQIQEVEEQNEDLLDRKINLEVGSYDYYVWQSPSGNTEFSAVTTIVESGKIIVEGEANTGTTFFTDSRQIIYFD
jgi:hypothetical protein